MSFMTCISFQPPLPGECENIDYDSSASDDEDLEIDYEEDEDVFKEPKVSLKILIVWFCFNRYIPMFNNIYNGFMCIFNG